jgi:hypothetical protein
LEAIQEQVENTLHGSRERSVASVSLADTRGVGGVPSFEENRRIQGM